MDDAELQAAKDEIDQVKHELEEAHDTDRNYLPPVLRELRNYVMQVHAEYEQSMNILLIINHLKSGIEYTSHMLLLEQVNFVGKMKVVKLKAPLFPLRTAGKLNALRNEFAHKEGSDIRNKYDDKILLSTYRFLKRCHDRLNVFWDTRKLD